MARRGAAFVEALELEHLDPGTGAPLDLSSGRPRVERSPDASPGAGSMRGHVVTNDRRVRRLRATAALLAGVALAHAGLAVAVSTRVRSVRELEAAWRSAVALDDQRLATIHAADAQPANVTRSLLEGVASEERGKLATIRKDVAAAAAPGLPLQRLKGEIERALATQATLLLRTSRAAPLRATSTADASLRAQLDRLLMRPHGVAADAPRLAMPAAVHDTLARFSSTLTRTTLVAAMPGEMAVIDVDANTMRTLPIAGPFDALVGRTDAVVTLESGRAASYSLDDGHRLWSAPAIGVWPDPSSAGSVWLADTTTTGVTIVRRVDAAGAAGPAIPLPAGRIAGAVVDGIVIETASGVEIVPTGSTSWVGVPADDRSRRVIATGDGLVLASPDDLVVVLPERATTRALLEPALVSAAVDPFSDWSSYLLAALDEDGGLRLIGSTSQAVDVGDGLPSVGATSPVWSGDSLFFVVNGRIHVAHRRGITEPLRVPIKGVTSLTVVRTAG